MIISPRISFFPRLVAVKPFSRTSQWGIFSLTSADGEITPFDLLF